MTHTFVALIVLGLATGAAAQSTGYPECDTYIAMVRECIRTKMPEKERAETQEQIEHFREMLANPFVGAGVAQKCGENIRLEMQRDRYGCYASRAAAAGVRTACSLLTPADLVATLGRPFTEGQPGNSKCTYAATTPGAYEVALEVTWKGGRDEMKAWRSGVRQVRARMRKDTGKEAPVGAEPVSGVGDDAFLVLAGITPMLAARKGDAAVSVRVHGATRDQLIALVGKALERLQ